MSNLTMNQNKIEVNRNVAFMITAWFGPLAILAVIELPSPIKRVIIINKRINNLWETVAGLLGVKPKAPRIKELKDITKYYIIEPHIEKILVENPKALSKWLGVSEPEMREQINNMNTNDPKQLMKNLPKKFGIDLKYDKIAAKTIAQNYNKNEIPSDLRDFFDKIIELLSV